MSVRALVVAGLIALIPLSGYSMEGCESPSSSYTVVGKHISKGWGGPTYFITVEDSYGGTYTYTVNSITYKGCHKGDNFHTGFDAYCD